MGRKSTRKRASRRDRRKAKQSRWHRPGKSTSSKVGHGGGGMITNKSRKGRIKVKKFFTPEPRHPIMKYSLSFVFERMYKSTPKAVKNGEDDT